MTITRGELAGKVLRVLVQTAQYPGFFKPESVAESIQEAIDFINVEFFTAVEGWAVKLHYYDTVANQISLPVLPSMAMIQEVRVLWGNEYLPLTYNDANRQPQVSSQSGITQWGGDYRIVDNELYFNPPLAVGGEKFVQVEYQGYSKRLATDIDPLESNFDFAMINFIKYRAASIEAARIEKFSVPWAGLESDWYQKIRQIIVKRNSQTTSIREFEG